MDNLKIGMIGLDTSHAIAFTDLLNNNNHEHHVNGGEVVIAFPGGSDMEFSQSRIEGYTTKMRDEFKIKIVDSMEEVAENCDAILLESVDGRVHLEQFSQIASFKKPTFIDKPLTTSVEEAKKILQIAKQNHTPVMSCSSLRYSESLIAILESNNEGTIFGADCYGPLEIEPTQGLFWYGIHTAEMLYRVLGVGCEAVTVKKNADHDLIIGEWKDGRIGTLRGNRIGNGTFGALIHRENCTQFVDVQKDQKPFYAMMLEEIIQFFKTGNSPINEDETLEIIQFLEAANESRENGKTVKLHKE